MARLVAAGLTDPGRIRQENQDHFVVAAEQGIFIVSDGMGGRAAGELASRIVVEALPPLLEQRLAHGQHLTPSDVAQEVAEILTELSNSVRDQSRRQPELSGMGATVVLALIRGEYALIAHMGDSRAYLHRDGAIRLLTHDHSIVQILLDNNEITPEETLTHPARSQITRYIGMEGESLPEVQALEMNDGDRLLLCTDGLTRMLTESRLTELLRAAPTPENACQSMINAANSAGGRDNITAIVINYANKATEMKPL